MRLYMRWYVCLYVHMNICASVLNAGFARIHPSVFPSVCPTVRPFIRPSARPSTYLSVAAGPPDADVGHRERRRPTDPRRPPVRPAYPAGAGAGRGGGGGRHGEGRHGEERHGEERAAGVVPHPLPRGAVGDDEAPQCAHVTLEGRHEALRRGNHPLLLGSVGQAAAGRAPGVNRAGSWGQQGWP